MRCWPSVRRYVLRPRTLSVRTHDARVVVVATHPRTVDAALAIASDPFAALDAVDERGGTASADTQYLELPRQPGGPPPRSADARVASLLTSLSTRLAAVAGDNRAAAGHTCVDGACAGPAYCVHHWLAPVRLDVAAAHVTYAHTEPLHDESRGDDIERGAAAVARLLTMHVAPATLRRAGADIGRLSALGYTLESLVVDWGYELEALVEGLGLDSVDALVALRFSPLLWRDRDRFPLVVFTERLGVRASLVAAYKLSYATLTSAFGLRLDELVLLGYRAPTLVAGLGMTADDVVVACGAAELAGYDAAWTYAALDWNTALFDALLPARSLTSDAYDRFADVVAGARAPLAAT